MDPDASAAHEHHHHRPRQVALPEHIRAGLAASQRRSERANAGIRAAERELSRGCTPQARRALLTARVYSLLDERYAADTEYTGHMVAAYALTARRPTTLADLPNELLLAVLEFAAGCAPKDALAPVYDYDDPDGVDDDDDVYASVRGGLAQAFCTPVSVWDDGDDNNSRASRRTPPHQHACCRRTVVPAMRLVSRRFCALSTPLLLPVVHVRMTLASVARLTRLVQEHPQIARGVRFVQVHTTDLNPALGHEDFAGFLARLGAAIRAFLQRADELRPQREGDGALRGEWAGLAAACERALAAQPPADERIWQLWPVHAELQQLYWGFRRLRDSSVFADTIALAMARMPRATRLCVTDVESRMDRSFTFCDAMPPPSLAAVRLLMTFYSGVPDPVSDERLERLNFGLLQVLPRYIAKKIALTGGTALTSLHIRMPTPLPPETVDDTYLSHVNLHGLAQACRSLHTLEFELDSFTLPKIEFEYAEFWEQDIKRLITVLMALLVSPQLRSVAIKLATLRPGSEARSMEPDMTDHRGLSLGAILRRLAPSSRPRLRRLSLKGFTCRIEELEEFNNRWWESGTVPHLVLEHVYLLGEGRWHRVLEILRGKVSDEFRLRAIYGGTDDEDVQDNVEYWDCFARCTDLEDYVTGKRASNPVVAYQYYIHE